MSASRHTSKTWLDGGAVLVTAAAFAVLYDLPGALAGGTLIVTWYSLSPMYAFAFGQFAVATLVAGGGTATHLAVLEGGLAGVLFGADVALERTWTQLVSVLGLSVVLGGIVYLGRRTTSTGWTGVGLLGTFVLAAVALRWVQRRRLVSNEAVFHEQ